MLGGGQVECLCKLKKCEHVWGWGVGAGPCMARYNASWVMNRITDMTEIISIYLVAPFLAGGKYIINPNPKITFFFNLILINLLVFDMFQAYVVKIFNFEVVRQINAWEPLDKEFLFNDWDTKLILNF